MTPFDEATASGLRMLKLFLPLFPPATQNMLAVFIKFIELQNVLRQQAPVRYDALSACDFSSGRGIENLFQDNAMENWMKHPAMKTIDPLKLELIRTAAKQTKGKSGNELAPVMLALITNANRQGLRFNPDEVSLILEVLKEGKSKEEQNQIDRMMEMTKNIFRKHFK